MQSFLCLVVGLISAFSLSGCIGENYDFTPPSVTLSASSIQLKEANINWQSDKQYKKETKDILSLARKQKQMSVNSGQRDYIEFDSEDYRVEEISIWVWQQDKKVKLELDKNRNFNFPKEKGEYLIEVDLYTDSGSAEYVGNIDIK
ncbi:hypothetical protein RCG23_02725 [Neobacillus sp. PS3-34]|uniref:hypothetical protein n=1 Tax=Neobacillus sp. PS3-34 TaxID=3070678 RepID=UPI0027DF489A|nr:hypothetical protein [Neobacillus sp. PS3-34]WML49038.1 hypothetical protein RCG23_02725 [Neobacillus sp. PS3-34]